MFFGLSVTLFMPHLVIRVGFSRVGVGAKGFAEGEAAPPQAARGLRSKTTFATRRELPLAEIRRLIKISTRKRRNFPSKCFHFLHGIAAFVNSL